MIVKQGCIQGGLYVALEGSESEGNGGLLFSGTRRWCVRDATWDGNRRASAVYGRNPSHCAPMSVDATITTKAILARTSYIIVLDKTNQR